MLGNNKGLNKSYNKKRLLNYAEWYTLKYLPSIKKLNNKLKEKTDNKEDIDYVLDKVSKFIDEEYLINDYITSWISSWKNNITLKNNLTNKLFNKDLINNFLLKNEENFLDINNYERFIIKELIKFKNKWKSKNASVISVIQKYYNFKDFIRKESNNIFWNDSENKAISSLIFKFKKSDIDKDKIISRLLWRWFNWEDIKKWLDNF